MNGNNFINKSESINSMKQLKLTNLSEKNDHNLNSTDDT